MFKYFSKRDSLIMGTYLFVSYAIQYAIKVSSSKSITDSVITLSFEFNWFI